MSYEMEGKILMSNKLIFTLDRWYAPLQQLLCWRARKRMKPQTVVIALMLLLLADVATTSSVAGSSLTLSGINEREANGDAHAFELYGDFHDNTNISSIVSCNGKLMESEISAPPLPTQIFASASELAD
jgi:hypothetical protein